MRRPDFFQVNTSSQISVVEEHGGVCIHSSSLSFHSINQYCGELLVEFYNSLYSRDFSDDMFTPVCRFSQDPINKYVELLHWDDRDKVGEFLIFQKQQLIGAMRLTKRASQLKEFDDGHATTIDFCFHVCSSVISDALAVKVVAIAWEYFIHLTRSDHHLVAMSALSKYRDKSFLKALTHVFGSSICGWDEKKEMNRFVHFYRRKEQSAPMLVSKL